MSILRQEQTRVTRDMLEPGDHIYRYGKGSSYTHHGIYVGEEMVIHYTRTEPGRREVISTISSTSSHHNSDSNACPKCNYKSDIHRGVVKTCLDCFLSGQNHIYLYKYGVSELQTLSDLNPGGTRVHSRPPSQVVNFASNLLEKSGFGNYNLFLKNCEDFAYYCKTGELGSGQVKFVVFYMMTIGLLIVTGSIGVISVKFAFEWFSLSLLLEFDIRVVLFSLFALIQLLETLGLFYKFFSIMIFARTLIDSDIRTFLELLLAISRKHLEFGIYITSRLIYIQSRLESKLFLLAIFYISFLLKLHKVIEIFSLAIYSIILFRSVILAIHTMTLFETGTEVSLLTYLHCTLSFFSLKFLDRMLFSISSMSPELFPLCPPRLFGGSFNGHTYKQPIIHLSFQFILKTLQQILLFVLYLLSLFSLVCLFTLPFFLFSLSLVCLRT